MAAKSGCLCMHRLADHTAHATSELLTVRRTGCTHTQYFMGLEKPDFAQCTDHVEAIYHCISSLIAQWNISHISIGTLSE